MAVLPWVLAGGCVRSPVHVAYQPVGPYRLGPDDLVEIYVFKDPELTRTIPVRPDGHISLPLAGEVEVAGLTPEQARVRIAERLHKWVSDPTEIAVIVHEIHSASVFVTGEVMKPGVFPMHGDTTVLQAVALAGGLGEFSARDLATVIRSGTGEKITVSITDPTESGVLVLRPGDTVLVR